MVPFDGSVVNLALPAIGRSLQAQLSSLVWIPASYLLVTAAFQAPMGRVGDVRGRKGVFSVGIAIFTLCSVLASFSPNVLMLIVSRIFQGVGGAIMSACSTAIVTDTFRNDRGRALGINTSAVYSGLSCGPILGAVLVQFVGWRSIFYVNVPIGVISLLLVLLYVPKDTKFETKRGFDISGSVMLALFLSAIMLFLSQTELSLSQFETLVFGVLAAISVLAFILIENKFAKDPVIDLKLFTQNRLFTAGNLSSIFNYTTNQGTLFVISLYLQFVHGYSPLNAALFLVAQPIVQAITSVFAGVLSDHIDARILSSVGIGFRAVGLFGLSFLTTASAPESVWIPMAIVGFGHGMFSPPNTNSVMSSVLRDKRGIAAGIMGTVRTACNSTGIVVMSAIIAGAMPAGAFAIATGSTGLITGALAKSFVLGMHYAFLFAGGFSAIGIPTSLVRGREQREGPSEVELGPEEQVRG
jgi:EmrB/QacA subfamily drug resistance transporter